VNVLPRHKYSVTRVKLCTAFSSTVQTFRWSMSAALSGSLFKPSVQNVHQLQQHIIKVSFKMIGLPYQWTPVENYSILIARHVFISAMLVGLACISDSVSASCPTHCNPMDWDLCIRLNYQRRYFCQNGR